MADGILLSSGAAEEIGELVRRISGDFGNERPNLSRAISYPGGDTAIIQVTKSRCKGKYFYGIILGYERESHTWFKYSDCWVFGPNDEQLVVGKRYVARRIAVATTTTTVDPTSSTTTSSTPECTTSTTTTTTLVPTTATTTPVPTTTTACPSIEEESLVFVVTGEVADYGTAGSGGTTTTYKPCHGYCEHKCEGHVWVKTSDNCCPPCVCQEPQFCCGSCGGDGEGDIVKTFCGVVVGKKQPSCPTSTTTTTTLFDPTSTTSTTTSTTFGPTCTGCTWLCVGGYWLPLSDNCPAADCPKCAAPTGPCADCDMASTGCTIPNPSTTTTVVPCLGGCPWYWFFSSWIAAPEGGCTAGATGGCVCEYPSFSGSSCGDFVITPCNNTTPEPTTSGTDTTTTDSTTTSTSWTTTTPCPTCCAGICVSKWNGSAWVIQCTNCPSSCVCPFDPPYSGSSTDEIAIQPCKATTTTSTTTTTSGTTTTTACGTCEWVWSTCGAEDVIECWTQEINGCTGPCSCCPPAFTGSYHGQLANTNCSTLGCDGTTTTGTSTTSTTTCTTATPGAPSCGVCYWTKSLGTCVWVLYGDACTDGCSCLSPDDCVGGCNQIPSLTFPCVDATSTVPP